MTLQVSDISVPTSHKTSSLKWIMEYMAEYDIMRTMSQGRLKVAPAA